MFEDYSDTRAMQVIGMQVIVCTFDPDNFGSCPRGYGCEFIMMKKSYNVLLIICFAVFFIPNILEPIRKVLLL
ncbi:TPA: hypothetical protein HA338_12465 [Methanosarcina acetivorans]|uniref:Uncharacterized protein n=1 Tax=Methanosarcina acetivorans TaxID=2214 RepID=A0A832WAI1_9EURY|nr:hypothetical protein [Methanosarcina acetivorans]HIH94791.1 hypothetical protein [Methanosarcina acetivorans]